MPENGILNLPISTGARTACQLFAIRNNLTRDDVVIALLQWFNQQDVQSQKMILEESLKFGGGESNVEFADFSPSKLA